ncbi:unnamed protein product [Clavelina lepadiformis]|uniref:Uncharacterized protein n=1 Tax=Clavelina lepadiformis TaxID=159417 RepID=A0ABP0GBI5_CLALP
MSKGPMKENVLSLFSSKTYLYEINPTSVGRAFIFANSVFEDENYDSRKGSEKDEKALEDLLIKVGFKTTVYKDLDQIGFYTKIKEISKIDFEEDSCMLLIVLSHGDKDTIMMHDGPVREDALYERFTADECKSLKNKPKIFLLQTCKGKKIDAKKPPRSNTKRDCIEVDAQAIPTEFTEENENSQEEDQDEDVIETEGEFSSTPAGADFIKCYATSHGYVAFRNLEHGSWFIQNFVEVFNAYLEDDTGKDIDFASLMMIVANRVANKTHRRRQKLCKQMPCTVSTLKKRIVFPKLRDMPRVRNPTDDNP